MMPIYSLYLKRLSLLCLLCTCIGGSLWVINHSSGLAQQHFPSDVPDSFMIDVSAIKLNAEGKPHYSLIAQNVKHYIQDDMSLIQDPFFTFYPIGEPSWTVKSKMAKVIHGSEKAWLTDHVFAQQPPGLHSRNLTLTTSRMTLYPDQALAVTDQPVTVVQPDSVIHSIGMQVDMNKNSVKFLSHTHGNYEGSLESH